MPIFIPTSDNTFHPENCDTCAFGCLTSVRLYDQNTSCGTDGLPVTNCDVECQIIIEIQPYKAKDGQMIDFDPNGVDIEGLLTFYYKPQTNSCGNDYVLSINGHTLIEYLGEWYKLTHLKSWKGDCCGCEGISHQEGMLKRFGECADIEPVEYEIQEEEIGAEESQWKRVN